VARVFVLLLAASAVVVHLDAIPAAPTGLSATVNGSTVFLSWTPPSGAIVTGYRLLAGTAPGATNAVNAIAGATPFFSATNVPPGTYYVRVATIANDGESPASNEVTVIVVGDGCSSAPPSPGLSASVFGSLVTFSWSVGPGCPPTSYFLHAGSFAGGSNIAVINVGPATAFSASAPNGIYYVRVEASNAFGRTTSNEAIAAVGVTPPVTTTIPVVPPVTTTVPATTTIPPTTSVPPTGNMVEVNTVTAAVLPWSTGRSVIVGEVTNRSNAMAAFVQINAALQNASGATIAVEDTYVYGRSRRLSSSMIITGTTLAPGESGCFLMFSDAPFGSVSRVVFLTDYDVRSASNLSGQIIVDGAPSRGTSLGRLRLTGNLRNTGSVLTYFNEVIYYMVDSGRAADCDSTYVRGSNVRLSSGITTDTGLLPAARGSYDMFTMAPPSASITGWTAWDEGRGAPADQAIASDLQSALDRRTRNSLRNQLEAERHERDRSQQH